MKILCSIVALFFSLSSIAQTKETIPEDFISISPIVEKNNFLFVWEASAGNDATYYVEASKDGKKFKQIAIVWGTTTELKNTCMFKEENVKLSKNFNVYRVSSSPATREVLN